MLLRRYITDHDEEIRKALAKAWNDVVTDERFETSPLTFRLDMLNRCAIVASWQPSNTNSIDEFDKAIKQWCSALGVGTGRLAGASPVPI